ncbi:MAG: rod-binding protein [Desulfuromonadales bacterium]|nr:rod-binding protein [Desulfuromonadales bacterium]
MDARIDTAQIFSQTTSQAPKAHKGQNEKGLKAVAQQFEAIFIQQMYKEMRKTVPDDGLIQRSNADDIFSQMQDLEAAKRTAEQGGIGLAELMLEQLQK